MGGMSADEIDGIREDIERGLVYLASCGAPLRSLGEPDSEGWTVSTLATALRNLWVEVERVASASSDDSSESFLFYDGGLAAILERLEAEPQ